MNMRYNDMTGVRDYIQKMVHLQTKLKAHDIPIPDKFINYQALNSLPSSFSQIKTVYNTLNQTWGVNDLITKCSTRSQNLLEIVHTNISGPTPLPCVATSTSLHSLMISPNVRPEKFQFLE